MTCFSLWCVFLMFFLCFLYVFCLSELIHLSFQVGDRGPGATSHRSIQHHQLEVLLVLVRLGVGLRPKPLPLWIHKIRGENTFGKVKRLGFLWESKWPRSYWPSWSLLATDGCTGHWSGQGALSEVSAGWLVALANRWTKSWATWDFWQNSTHHS